jgi:hypothetical protein
VSRSHGPDEFLDPRHNSAEAMRDARPSDRPESSREQGHGSEPQEDGRRTTSRAPELTQPRSAEPREAFEVHGRTYRLRSRIEYETREGEMARVDLELATEHYRGRNLVEKVRAGFSIYAHAQDATGLRRVLDQRELTAEILSL